jgi:hypothetical protein
MQALVSKGIVAINEEHFPNLVQQMRTATEQNGKLDKSLHPLDLLDALHLNLKHYVLVEI